MLVHLDINRNILGIFGSARNDSSSVLTWEESDAEYGINAFEIHIPKTPVLCLIITKPSCLKYTAIS